MCAAVQAAIVLSIVSNCISGRGIGNVSCKYTLSFSPRNRAFAIWIVIYAQAIFFTLAQQVAQLLGEDIFAKEQTLLFYALAWAMAALWTPVFGQGTKVGLAIASSLLIASCAYATLAITTENPWGADKPYTTHWIIGLPLSLLAGWVFVAAALSFGIAWTANRAGHQLSPQNPQSGHASSQAKGTLAVPVAATVPCIHRITQTNSELHVLTAIVIVAVDTPCEPSRKKLRTLFDPIPAERRVTYAPLLLSLAAATLSLLTRDPVYPLPVAWAVLWMQPSWINRAGFVVLVISSAAVLCTVYVF